MLGSSKRQKGFTLIELLVVIAIIAVLIGLLVPAVQKVREAANRMSCSNNLKNLALAYHNFESTNGCFPYWGYDFATNPNPSNPLGAQTQGHNHLTVIMPFIEQENLLKVVNANYSVADTANLPPPYGTGLGGGTKVKTVVCPSSPERSPDYIPYFSQGGVPNLGPMILAATDYNTIFGIESTFATNCAAGTTLVSGDVGILGAKGAAGPNGPGRPRMADVIDGLSNTILLVENAGRQQVWLKGAPVSPNTPGSAGWTLNGAWADYNTNYRLCEILTTTQQRATTCNVINQTNLGNTRGGGIYAFHSGGANVALGDGSVRFISASLPAIKLAQAITRAGSEVSSLDQ